MKTLDTVTIKASNNSEAGCLITLFYFRNTYPSIISDLDLYWVGNKYLSIFNSIQLVINLKCIPTPFRLWSKCKISTYKKEQNIRQVCNQKTWNVWSDLWSENMWSHVVWDAKFKFLLGLWLFEIYGFGSKEKNLCVK